MAMENKNKRENEVKTELFYKLLYSVCVCATATHL